MSDNLVCQDFEGNQCSAARCTQSIDPEKIFIVIPVHNRIHYTQACLRSLERQAAKGFRQCWPGEMSLDDAIAKPELEGTDGINLSVITSGAVPTNPSEILGSAQMKELIDRVREQYDVVLMDSAPVLGMTDTAVLASESDAAVMVIKTGEATRKALKMAISQLESVGVDVTGVILNNVDVKHDGYYDYYYYYYYSPYGDDENGKVKKRKKRSDGNV